MSKGLNMDNNFKRKSKIRDKDGKIIREEDVDEMAANTKVRHTSLNDELLLRINIIYNKFRPFLSKAPGTLEQFEFGFMKDINPENGVAMWEDMVITFEIASRMYKEDEGIKENIYNCLIMNSIDALTPEEEKLEFTSQIVQLFNKVVQSRKNLDNDSDTT